MSIRQTFPDAVLLPDGSLRLVTQDARSWMYSNTNLSCPCSGANDVPQFILPAPGLVDVMRLDGLVVREKKSSLSKRIA